MIFLDNASTTKLCERARNEIEKSHDLFFNPSASYNAGFEVKKKIIEAKKNICAALGVVYNDNLIITASATEANNLAIFGSIRKTQEQLIFGAGEHPSVYNCALELKARGYNVKFCPLTASGECNIDVLKELLNEPTSFVSIMHVSNETGAINDIQKIAKLIKQKQPAAIFHCDGVQAFGKIHVNIAACGADLYTVSAHKIGGPKGIGALYVKNVKKLKPIIFGGGQENGLRSGTENTPHILAFGEMSKNLEIDKRKEIVARLNEYVRNFFELTCKEQNLPILLNSPQNASPYILNYSFGGIRGETLVHLLENKGVIVGTGSACSSKKGSLNRTLEAMGRTKEQNEGSIRISFSPYNTIKEIKMACEVILEEYKELRKRLSIT